MLTALFSRLFRRTAAPAAAAPATVSATAVDARDTSARPATPPPQWSLRREAVLGSNERVAGYRFTVDHGGSGSGEKAEALIQLLLESRLADTLGYRLAFIDLPSPLLASPRLQELPAKRCVLVVTPAASDGAAPADTLAAMHALRAQGFLLAVGEPLTPAGTALLAAADLAVLDARALHAADARQLRDHLARHAPAARILARSVTSLEEARFCRSALDVAFLEGGFVTQRENWDDRELGPRVARLATLLGRLRKDADTEEIVALLKQDAALSLRLLRYVNSAGSGVLEPVHSIERAFILLGRSALQRWLLILLCGLDDNGGRASAALESALVRARMMELLGAARPRPEQETLFLTGLLSLIDVILQVPMEKAIGALAVGPEIAQALTRGEGEHALLLEIACACEAADPQQVLRAATRLQLEPASAAAAHAEALNWTFQLQDA